jgi:hypothetical protein
MYCVQKVSTVNGDNLDELEPYLTKHQWHLKLWVLIPKATFDSHMLLYMIFTMLSKTEFLRSCTRTLLWNSVGRPFDIDRSNYVVAYYHTELVQMLSALELDDLSISDYSCIFDDSYSLLKSIITDQFTDYLLIFGSLQRAFINLSHVGLSSQRNGSLS